MSGIVAPITGLPGLRAAKVAANISLFKGGSVIPDFLPQGKLINGALSRDPLNTGNIDVLRAGLLMGKITATGLYAPSIMGVSTVANNIGDAIVTMSVATATELVRRVGSTGTFTLTGPSTAGGVVQSVTVTYSAVNLTTGVATVTALTSAFIAGSLIGGTDGSQNPITMIFDGYGVKVTDTDGVTNVTAQFPNVPVGGELDTTVLVNYPTDPSLINWIKARLNTQNNGGFTFSDAY